MSAERHTGKLVYVGQETHEWSLAIEGSVAHKDPACTYGPDHGGVVGSSEWIWLSDEDAARIVACWNACEGVDNPAEMRKSYDQRMAALRDSV